MTKGYEFHEYANIFPFHDDDSLTELADNIKEREKKFGQGRGQIEDIVLFERMVLEGRRRQTAMLSLGLEPRYRKFGSRPGDGTDPLEFAFNANYQRRNLSEAERVLAARAYATLKKGDNRYTIAGKSEDPTKVGSTPVSQKEAAAKFGVNPKQIERANKVMERGISELQEAVKEQEVSITDAADIADEPPDIQREALASVRDGTSKTLRSAVAEIDPNSPEEATAAFRRKLESLEREGRQLPTNHIKARDALCKALKSAIALTGKL